MATARWIVDEPELHLGRNILIPDLAGWRRSRLAAIPHEGTETVRAGPFEELEIALRDLWIEPIEPAP